MDFKLTKEQQLAQELFRSFAENEIKPLAHDMDEAEQLDMELLGKMQRYGFFGIPSPRSTAEQAETTLHTLFAWRKFQSRTLPAESLSLFTLLFAAHA